MRQTLLSHQERILRFVRVREKPKNQKELVEEEEPLKVC